MMIVLLLFPSYYLAAYYGFGGDYSSRNYRDCLNAFALPRSSPPAQGVGAVLIPKQIWSIHQIQRVRAVIDERS